MVQQFYNYGTVSANRSERFNRYTFVSSNRIPISKLNTIVCKLSNETDSVNLLLTIKLYPDSTAFKILPLGNYTAVLELRNWTLHQLDGYTFLIVVYHPKTMFFEMFF